MKNIKDIDPVKIIIILVLAVAIIGFLYYLYSQFMDKIDLEENQQLAKNDALTAGGVENLAKKIPAKDLPKATTDLKNFDPIPFGRMIQDANGVFSNNVAEVYNAFGTLKSQRELAYVANYFKKLKNMDLFTYLNKMGLETDELAHINKIVEKLPLY